MIPSFDNDRTINSAIFTMTCLSPKAKSHIELESYRQSASLDECTEQHILESTFGEFIKDLETIGLTIDLDYSMYCNEMGLLFSFLNFSSILLPNTLYETIRTNEKVRNLITGVINGSLGNDHTAVEIYLSEIAGLDDQVPIFPELSDYIDQIYVHIKQTELFTDYLQNMIQLSSEERIMIESDHVIHSRYTDKLRDVIGRLSDAVNLFEGSEIYDKVCRIQHLIIRDLTSADNFHWYSYLLLETEWSIPEDLIESYRRRWYHYYVSHSWCYDYYTLRNISITDVSEITIPCFIYAINNDVEMFLKKLNSIEVIPTHISDSILKLYKESV